MEIAGKGTCAAVRNKKGKITGYRIRFFLGHDKATDTDRFSPWKSGFKGIREARKAMEQYRIELEAGMHAGAKLTFEDYAWCFHEERVSAEAITPESAAKEKVLIKRICRYIGKEVLTAIEPGTITAAYQQMREDRESQNSLHETHKKLRQIIRRAIKQHRIVNDPTDSVIAPSKPRPLRRALDKSELARFTEELSHRPLDGYSMFVWIVVVSGMRRSECLGLTWDKINLDEAYVDVNQVLGSDRTIRKRAKTEKSNRRIPLDAATVERMKAWKAVQAEYFLGLGVAQNAKSPVCSNQYCGFIHKDHIERWWHSFCVANGFGIWRDVDGNELPQQQYNDKGHPLDGNGRPYSRTNPKPRRKRYYDGLKIHELRHTVGTHLIGAGIDFKTAQDILGHASAATTIDLYAHALDENKRMAINAFASLFSDSEPTPQNKVIPLRKAAN
jgi:integrase